MAQSPMVSLSPCVELPIRGDGRTVPTATSYLTYMLPLQGLNHLGTIIAPEEREREMEEARGRKEEEEEEEEAGTEKEEGIGRDRERKREERKCTEKEGRQETGEEGGI